MEISLSNLLGTLNTSDSKNVKVTIEESLPKGEDSPKISTQAEVKKHEDFSIIPLAIPITFGLGVFATIVLLKGYMS